MRKNIIIMFLVSLTVILGTTTYASNFENGFMQYTWGDNASKHTGLSIVGQKGEVAYYSKPGEEYTIGNVTIDKIIYGFHQDHLFGVYLNINSAEVYDKLFNHMKSLYGLPASKLTAGDQSVYKWKQPDVTIKLKLDKPTQKMKLSFYYRPIASTLNTKQWEELDTSSFRFVPIEKDKKPEKWVLFEF
ncbi:hypothetical protein [Desulforhopalus sp. 52FAK]